MKYRPFDSRPAVSSRLSIYARSLLLVFVVLGAAAVSAAAGSAAAGSAAALSGATLSGAALSGATVRGQADPTCNQIVYRLSQPDREVWYRHGETVQVVTGRDAELFVHVDLERAAKPYATRADIGYPQEFDFDTVSSQEVLRHVRMRAQSAEDLAQGRIRFKGEDPGTTQLGYVIEDVVEGAEGRVRLSNIATACRRDQVTIQVVPSAAQLDLEGRSEPPRFGTDEGASQPLAERRAAAEVLIGRLSDGLLQRDPRDVDPRNVDPRNVDPRNVDPRNVDPRYVETVLGDSRRGVELVTEAILSSREFRSGALERIESRFGNASDEQLRRRLLDEIYRDFYGFDEPPAAAQREDFNLLEGCMSYGRSADSACRDLAGRLVDRRAFSDRHQQLLDSLRGEVSWRK